MCRCVCECISVDAERLCFYWVSLIQPLIKENLRNNTLVIPFSLRMSSIDKTVYLIVDISGYALLFEQ